MIKTVFFDLDGTLIDIKASQNLACTKFYHKYGFGNTDTAENFSRLWDELLETHYHAYLNGSYSFSEQQEKRVMDIFHHYSLAIPGSPRQIYDDYLSFFRESWKLFDDVLPCLESLSSAFQLGIITNGNGTQQRDKIKDMGLERYFSHLFIGSEINLFKPSPAIFTYAAKNIGLENDEFCYIGDCFETDILPCLNLGIMAVYLDRNDEIQSESLNYLKLKTLNELPDFLQDFL